MFQQDPDCPLNKFYGDDRLLKMSDVIARLGVSRSTIWRLTQSGGFPRPVPISPGRKGWLKSQVDAWIANRLRAERQTMSGRGP
jgi:prophage regulatory protein